MADNFRPHTPQEIQDAVTKMQDLMEAHNYNMVLAFEVENADGSLPKEAEGVCVSTALSPYRSLPLQVINRVAHEPNLDRAILPIYLDLLHIGAQNELELFKIIRLLFAFTGKHIDVDTFREQLRIQAPAFSDAAFDLRKVVNGYRH